MKLMTLAVFAALLHTTLPAQAEDKVLNLYGWADYVAPNALKAFEAQTGIKVKYDTFDSNDVLESKLLTGGSGYDVVIPSSPLVARAITAKALQPSGVQQLPGFGNLDPAVLAQLNGVDPGNRFAVPYTWGTVGLAFNRQAIAQRIPNAPLDSLDLLFKPEYASRLKDCGIAVVDAPQEVISIALRYLGKPPYSEEPADLATAKALLKTLQPNLRYVGLGAQINDLANGNLCLALTYNGDASMAATQAKAAGKPFDVDYRIPREGTLMWVDTVGTPADAPHPEAARAFIAFMLRAQSMAELTDSLYFASANQAATPLVNPQIATDPQIYPPAEIRARLFAEQTLPAKLMRERTRLWTSFRTAN